MQNNTEKIKRLQKQVELIDKQLELLALIDQCEAEQETNSTHNDNFPIGSTVRFSTEPSEKRHLRGKEGTVIGHSPKFVRVRRGRETHRRLPKNLDKVLAVEDGEREKEPRTPERR